jgi:hypothetical protein
MTSLIARPAFPRLASPMDDKLSDWEYGDNCEGFSGMCSNRGEDGWYGGDIIITVMKMVWRDITKCLGRYRYFGYLHGVGDASFCAF